MATQESDVSKEVRAALEMDPRVDLHRDVDHKTRRRLTDEETNAREVRERSLLQVVQANDEIRAAQTRAAQRRTQGGPAWRGSTNVALQPWQVLSLCLLLRWSAGDLLLLPAKSHSPHAWSWGLVSPSRS